MSWTAFEGEVKGRERPKGPLCAVGKMLDALPDDGRLAVEKALGNRGLTGSGIRRALIDRLGHEATPSSWSIRNHRRRECRCWEVK